MIAPAAFVIIRRGEAETGGPIPILQPGSARTGGGARERDTATSTTTRKSPTLRFGAAGSPGSALGAARRMTKEDGVLLHG